jgi:glycosyltransferase involved in cell wall biosynthesis
MRIAIISDQQVKQGGTSEIIKHMDKALSPVHQITARYLNREEYMPRLFPKRWESIYRILFLRLVSKDRQFDRFDMIITLQPDSHCIKHRNHIVYFQHHMRQYYDLFGISLNQRKKIRGKILFLLLTTLARLADKLYLTPNLRSSHVLVNSKTVALRLIKYNNFSAFDIVSPGCTISSNGTSIDYTLDAVKHQPEPMILAFSRLDLIQKGIDLILEAAVLVPNYKFIIAGSCSNSLLKVGRYNIPNVLFVAKNFSNEEKDDLFRKCDVFLAPYIDEDFGIAPLEANSYGKPVVYCNDSGEIVNTQVHKITGYMCLRNAHSIVKGIEFCMSKKDKMKTSCVLNGSKYSWKNFEDSIRRHVESMKPKR